MDPMTAAMIAASVNQAGSFLGAIRQERANIRMMDRQNQFNMDMLMKQLEYNSPAAQMKRFEQAGLNPKLIYGQAQSGNWSQQLQSANVQAADWQSAPSIIGSQIMDAMLKSRQSELLESQADLNRVKKDESGIKQDLMRAQKALTEANPYLSKGYVEAMVSQLQSVARMKESEASLLLDSRWPAEAGNLSAAGAANLMERQIIAKINQLETQFKLQKADLKVRAEIIQSKEFQNELQKIQVDWMKNAELTPQHIYTGIMMLLGKLMR